MSTYIYRRRKAFRSPVFSESSGQVVLMRVSRFISYLLEVTIILSTFWFCSHRWNSEAASDHPHFRLSLVDESADPDSSDSFLGSFYLYFWSHIYIEEDKNFDCLYLKSILIK